MKMERHKINTHANYTLIALLSVYSLLSAYWIKAKYVRSEMRKEKTVADHHAYIIVSSASIQPFPNSQQSVIVFVFVDISLSLIVNYYNYDYVGRPFVSRHNVANFGCKRMLSSAFRCFVKWLWFVMICHFIFFAFHLPMTKQQP